VKLDFKHVGLRLAHTWNIARTRGMRVAEVVQVCLTDLDCLEGIGEAAPIGRYGESVRTVEAFLAKVDAQRLRFDSVAESQAYLEALSPGDLAAKCAVNVALLDGAAKRQSQSLHDFVGLSFRENHYVTSFTIGMDQPQVIEQKVIAAGEYPILKMKMGTAEDKMHLASLRHAAAVKPVRVDANEGWATREQALEMIEWLASDGHVEFVEQPMPASKPVADWAWLKERSPLPIVADESFSLKADLAVLGQCFHGLNVKLVKTAGVTDALTILKKARAAGLKTMLGCMVESSILISAAAHLAELCDFLDLDGNLLITNDPYVGVIAERGVLSFRNAPAKFGLQTGLRQEELNFA
jgi:L-alanine-DL-glutamate epimerase-like enolase superfamily enzyme